MRSHLYLSVLSRSLRLCFLLVSPIALAQIALELAGVS